VKINGTFLNNLSHGNWTYFSEEGEVLYSIEFQNGRAIDQEKYLEIMQDTLSKFEFPEEPESSKPF
jgi:antitoxin component YwqK of YwqJK toxin-antitoxin module